MPALVDLHLHTTASDGRLTPPELVRLLDQRGLRVVAITDHDSTEGLATAQEEARKHANLTLIPGVELGADVPDGEIHVLGYFLHTEDQELQGILQRFRDGRALRGRRMVEKLAELGIELDWARVEEFAQGGAIARPHIARAMVEKGYVSLPGEAFDSYIGRNGPAYVEREKLSPEDAVRLITHNGGLPVLAHPARYVLNLEETLPRLKDAGLVGMEAHYNDYTPEEVDHLLSLCQQYDLVPCGGSDYHALGIPGEIEPGTVGPPMESIERLKALLG